MIKGLEGLEVAQDVGRWEKVPGSYTFWRCLLLESNREDGPGVRRPSPDCRVSRAVASRVESGQGILGESDLWPQRYLEPVTRNPEMDWGLGTIRVSKVTGGGGSLLEGSYVEDKGG